MANVTITMRPRVAWWVRPALAVAFVIARLAEHWIGAIVDHGIKFDVETDAA